MKTAFNILGAIALAMALGACGKKSSNSSAVATTPNNCTFNGYAYVVTGTSTSCTPTTTSVTCTLNSTTGQYLNQYGQVCDPNQVNTPIYNGGFGTGDGCSQYYYQYGVQYIPINMNGQMMCIRYDLVQGYYAQAGQQYYGQPIYGGYWGGQNGYYGSGGYGGYYGNTSCINIGGQSWGSQYGINGNIGFCF